MRINWKKRLGVCGALTLLCLTLVSGAFTSMAGAATGDIQVVGIFQATDLPGSDFSFHVVGSAGYDQTFQWVSNGVAVVVPLTDDQTYTVTPVPHDGFTVTVDDNIPGITCTDVTIDPVTPAFCRMTYTPIPPSTTTIATTTTTQGPTTTPPAGIGETIHGSRADSNRCTSHLEPQLQADANLRIGVILGSDAFPQPHHGNPITLSNTTVTIKIPATLIQAGVDLDLIKNNDQVPSTLTIVVTGNNTTQGSHTYVINTTATIHTVKVPVSATFPKGVKALPLNATLNMPNTNWTPVSDTADVHFAQKSLKIVSHLTLPGVGAVTATFTCNPDSTASFVALGAVGAPTPGGGGGGGGTTPTSAAGGAGVTPAATTLPRTGSNPWPLLVLAAILIDLGLLAVAGAKRGRRLLHR